MALLFHGKTNVTAEFKLIQTCGACPEQYDVYRGDDKVGYLRLRHGYFRAECHGEVVYEAHVKGDGLFEEDEREQHLNLAVTAIKAKLCGAEKLYEIEYE